MRTDETDEEISTTLEIPTNATTNGGANATTGRATGEATAEAVGEGQAQGKVTWFKYVPHSVMLLHLARGWQLDDDLQGVGHGHWSTLMRWTGEGDPT